MAAVFEHVVVIAPQTYLDFEHGGNFVLVGSKVPLDAAAIEANMAGRGGNEVAISGGAVTAWIDGARILTDDFAPVDQLIGRP